MPYKIEKRLIISIFLMVMIAGCASHHSPEVYADPYGFFSGLWHGFISPLTILVNIVSWMLSLIGISFFSDIQIIGRPNTSFFYYFGFFIGFISICGAGNN